ncbi:MAG: GNAT family protein [Bdellovibrionota bacterium]
MSYSFQQFENLKGPRLTLKRAQTGDLLRLGNSLVSPSTWFSVTRKIDSVESFKTYFDKILERQNRGEALVLIAEYQDEITAMSVFQYPSENFSKVEIGFTWIADKWQRTFVNSEMKLLMLDYAFGTMKVNRVEFSVHPDNQKSNQAMVRLGATLEGTLRKWRFLPGVDDGNRNMYSIIDNEWPIIRQKLNLSLSRQ